MMPWLQLQPASGAKTREPVRSGAWLGRFNRRSQSSAGRAEFATQR